MESTYHENYVKQLQRLLKAVAHSQKKFTDASDHIESADFKNLFNRYSDERRQIVIELTEAIKKLGGKVDDSLLIDSNPHHFNSTHSTPGTKKDQAVLEKVRNSEQETLDTYDDVLQGSILEEFDLKTLIMSQRLIVSEAFTELDRRYFSLFKLSEPY
jgi:uncharacterized protein (TIGR02284 family)